jgi:hypothetical protein
MKLYYLVPTGTSPKLDILKYNTIQYNPCFTTASTLLSPFQNALFVNNT